jgi:hypothetical protein
VAVEILVEATPAAAIQEVVIQEAETLVEATPEEMTPAAGIQAEVTRAVEETPGTTTVLTITTWQSTE